jgi:hypothetical protein
MVGDWEGGGMSEAPERIWIERGDECPYFYVESELADAAPPLVEYRRADLAGLPEDLVWRLRSMCADPYTATELERDILAWHEQQVMMEIFGKSGDATPSAPDGVGAPDSRERPALFGDLVDSDVRYLLDIAQGCNERDEIRLKAIATRMEVLLGAYNTALSRERHEVNQLSAGLPEELVGRLAEMLHACWPDEAKHQAPMEELLRDILAWHEQQTGEKE